MTKSKNGMVTRDNTPLATYKLPGGSNKNHIYITRSGKVLVPFTQINSYLTRCSWEILIFATTITSTYLLWCLPGNHTTFGFTHFSLNLVNSAKVI